AAAPAPVCDGDPQRRHWRDTLGCPAPGFQGPQRFPGCPRPPLAQRSEGGGVGRVSCVPVLDPTPPGSCHPRPRPLPRGPLVRRGDDRSPPPDPTYRPARIPAGVRTRDLPIPLPPTRPLGSASP